VGDQKRGNRRGTSPPNPCLGRSLSGLARTSVCTPAACRNRGGVVFTGQATNILLIPSTRLIAASRAAWYNPSLTLAQEKSPHEVLQSQGILAMTRNIKL